MIAFVFAAALSLETHVLAAEAPRPADAWLDACAALLEAGGPYDFMTVYPALEAAMDLARETCRIDDDQIGRLRCLVHMTLPVPFRLRFRTQIDGRTSATVLAERTGETRPGDTARSERDLAELDRKLSLLDEWDLRAPLDDALPGVDASRVGITYAADFGNGQVNLVTDALLAAEVPYRVSFSRFVQYDGDSLAYDTDAIDVEHFEFRHPRPSPALIRAAARRFLRLDARKFENARLDVRRTATGFRVGVRKSSTGEHLDLKVTRVTDDRFAMSLDLARSGLVRTRVLRE